MTLCWQTNNYRYSLLHLKKNINPYEYDVYVYVSVCDTKLIWCLLNQLLKKGVTVGDHTFFTEWVLLTAFTFWALEYRLMLSSRFEFNNHKSSVYCKKKWKNVSEYSQLYMYFYFYRYWIQYDNTFLHFCTWFQISNPA